MKIIITKRYNLSDRASFKRKKSMKKGKSKEKICRKKNRGKIKWKRILEKINNQKEMDLVVSNKSNKRP